MAFGFLGDIVEGIGDVILGPSGGGQRGARLGASIGTAVSGGSPYGTAIGAQLGSSLSQAVSSPTPQQTPGFAPETAVSSQGPNVYRGTTYQPIYTAGLPSLPKTATDILGGALGGAAMDIIPDINISKFFGSSAVCATKPSGAPITIRPDGCITVSRKQQAKLKVMVQTIGLPAVANALNLSEGEVAALLLKNFPRRGKGITAAQLRNAKRVNRTIMGMAKQLQDACKTTTRRR